MDEEEGGYGGCKCAKMRPEGGDGETGKRRRVAMAICTHRAIQYQPQETMVGRNDQL